MRTAIMLILAIAAGCAERSSAETAKSRSLDELVSHPTEAPATAEPAKEAAAKPAAHPTAGPGPLEALARLSAGNARFATGRRNRSATAGDDAAERVTTAKGQHPFAAILTCADSRVPPELLFDQSLGDLFVVRNAGNIADPLGEGSLEYAVEHLGVRLIIVLGHGSCGAVTAVATSAGQLPGHLADIQRGMPGLREFALERGKAGPPEAVIPAAVERNACAQAAALVQGSEALREALAAGAIAVLPANYDLASGVVGFLPPVPAPASTAHAAGH